MRVDESWGFSKPLVWTPLACNSCLTSPIFKVLGNQVSFLAYQLELECMSESDLHE